MLLHRGKVRIHVQKEPIDLFRYVRGARHDKANITRKENKKQIYIGSKKLRLGRLFFCQLFLRGGCHVSAGLFSGRDVPGLYRLNNLDIPAVT